MNFYTVHRATDWLEIRLGLFLGSPNANFSERELALTSTCRDLQKEHSMFTRVTQIWHYCHT